MLIIIAVYGGKKEYAFSEAGIPKRDKIDRKSVIKKPISNDIANFFASIINDVVLVILVILIF